MGSFVNSQQSTVALKQGPPPITGLYVEQGQVTAGSLPGTSGDRLSRVKVTYKKAFNAAPVVQANLKLIDFGNSKNTRADVWVTDVTKTDFVVNFRTWSDSDCYGIQANWLAIGSSD